MQIRDPQDSHQVFAAAFNSGDVDTITTLSGPLRAPAR